jgi:predicted amino acid racemase
VFLSNLIRQNPEFAAAVIDLHQAGELPPDCYVIDLDTMAENARTITGEAHRLGMSVIAMTKQFGRNPDALRTLRENGVDSFVAVDVTCARAIARAGERVGHVGHLVQIPRHQADEVATMNPDYWTVFSETKAAEAGAAARRAGREQNVLARIFGPEDDIVETHAGGFDAADVLNVADTLDRVEGAAFAGITSYSALTFDRKQHVVRPTPNLATLTRAAEALHAAGRNDVEVNAPGETSTAVLSMLADAGATQVEPGHGFTATGAYHAFADLPERPAMVYLSEVSHKWGDTSYCYGGGLYLCIGSVDYEPTAIVGRDLKEAVSQRVPATLSQNHQVIDFYGRLGAPDTGELEEGDSVLFCFRAQTFYTRSTVAAISGVHTGQPRVEGLYTVDGRPL